MVKVCDDDWFVFRRFARGDDDEVVAVKEINEEYLCLERDRDWVAICSPKSLSLSQSDFNLRLRAADCCSLLANTASSAVQYFRGRPRLRFSVAGVCADDSNVDLLA